MVSELESGDELEKRVFREFVRPPRSLIRDDYFITVDTLNNVKEVQVRKTSDRDHIIFEYQRSADLRTPFEPFRFLSSEGEWKDYALFSDDSSVSSIKVLDLHTGNVVAEHVGMVVDEDLMSRRHSAYMKGAKLGDIKEVIFSAVDFYVPDFWDEFNEAYIEIKTRSPNPDKVWLVEEEELLELYSGQFAFFSGLDFYDDTGGYYLRCLDLSKISEGKIFSENRFGDFMLSNSPEHKIQDLVSIEDHDMIVLPTIVYGSIKKGEIRKPSIKMR